MTQITEAKSEEEVKHITKQLLNKIEKIKSISTLLRLYTIFENQLVPQHSRISVGLRPKVQEVISRGKSDGLFKQFEMVFSRRK